MESLAPTPPPRTNAESLGGIQQTEKDSSTPLIVVTPQAHAPTRPAVEN
jgi:hypothetical protein